MNKTATSLAIAAISLSLSSPELPASQVADLTQPRSMPSQDFLAPSQGEAPSDAQAMGDYYSLSPTVGDDLGDWYYLSDSAAPTLHLFDGSSEAAGGNYFGTVGGSIFATESIVPVAAGIDRFLVQVSTIDSNLNFEPWVDSSWTGSGLANWRLDVGTNFGGTDPIHLVYPTTVLGSGVFAYDSTGASLGEFPLYSDTSTSTSLSGIASLGLDGADIAGYDLASLLIYWDITRPADVAIQVVDATNGTYPPGSGLNVELLFQNVGFTASTSSTFRVYASSDNVISAADRLLGSFVLPSINPGATNGGIAPAVLPADLANGDYYIGVILEHFDPDSANNVNFDPVPITVSNSPDIRIRPLSLDFVEQAPEEATASADRLSQVTLTAWSRESLPLLLNKAEANGEVRVLVAFDVPILPDGLLSGTARQVQRQKIRNRGDELINALRGFSHRENARYRFIPYMALTVDSVALERLANLPFVKSIQEDVPARPLLESSSSVIGSPLAWAEGYDGAGQAVAVLDSGVDKTHPWFTTGSSKVVAEACYSTSSEDSVSLCPGEVPSSTASGSGVNCDVSIPGCDHGTHVAGIVAGNDGVGPDFGVARGADIIAMQVFSRFDDEQICGTGEAPCVRSFTSDQISALERVYDLKDGHEIAAVNMSLGGGRYFDQASCDISLSATKAAIDNLRSVGIATVTASGNSSYTDSIGGPACISSAISVGNTTDSDDISPSSNIYPEIHLLAPGTSITSSLPGGGLGLKTGTSMAAPQVAGAWAVLKQQSPDDSVDQVLAKLQITGTLVHDLRVGGIETDMPRINVDLALASPRSTFGIFNDGYSVLNVTSISAETLAPWISWDPPAPFSVQPGELKVVKVSVDFASAPDGDSQTRLLVHSNDGDETPYPGGILINVSALDTLAPEFNSVPSAGSDLAFGDQFENIESPPSIIEVTNAGTADLTLACVLSGADGGSFLIKDCPTPIAVAGAQDISVTCKPDSIGLKSAVLTVTTNDSDEPSVDYYLTCTGIQAPDIIFQSGFEN